MIEFQEFPKMLYHPKTGEQVIVRDAVQEADQLEAWGVIEPPKLSLQGSDGDAPKAAPKPRAARKAKAAN